VTLIRLWLHLLFLVLFWSFIGNLIYI
jgi:hypothetical protein